MVLTLPADYWAPLFRALGKLDLQGGHLEVVLDFDGTLAPIVAIPSRAEADPDIHAVLPRIMADGTLTVISGRPVTFLVEKLAFLASLPGSDRVTFYGHYGLEACDLAGNAIASWHLDPSELELLDELRASWLAEPIAGVLFEDKINSLALHFRNAPDAREELLDWLEMNLPTRGLMIRPGKMVYEVTPVSSPSKESIVERVASRGSVAVFAGDDVGDAGVFRLFNAQRAKGLARLSILVKGGFETPPELLSLCDIAVPGPKELAWVLDQIHRAFFPSR